MHAAHNKMFSLNVAWLLVLLLFFFFFLHTIYLNENMSLAPSSFQTSKAQVTISYKINGDKNVIRHKNELVQPDRPFINQNIQVSAKVVRHSDGKGGYLLSYHVKAFKAIELVKFEVTYMADLKDQRMMANGFQSWSQAREFTSKDKIPAIRTGIAWYTQLNLQG